jgi:hypothetical protein
MGRLLTNVAAGPQTASAGSAINSEATANWQQYTAASTHLNLCAELAAVSCTSD